MTNLERLSKINQAERAAQKSALDSLTRNVRENAKISDELDLNTKGAVLEALNVSIDDFVSDIFDRSSYYEGMTLGQQVRNFLVRRIEDYVLKETEDKDQKEALFRFMRDIATVG
ncbi:hypothetical protein A3A39_03985 [Candidatus Kaiserbacteria bacterium RIFCSPLOWO2_01_FULL_54_13]|uniref:Uncharacterized protein n=1 Tax=Candidatus Kaiserbacteria bacterium RIFCSPLOWO2_01_FULL_54_13 TaxID=1798512 RepID=A0A1F6F425_9BACT|nr:MAG: hypothetical protein A3A39_03985 [Candidatus Kaiserbacteria bacterium RIFCSPLOWO2_01_FULL_54_13]